MRTKDALHHRVKHIFKALLTFTKTGVNSLADL